MRGGGEGGRETERDRYLRCVREWTEGPCQKPLPILNKAHASSPARDSFTLFSFSRQTSKTSYGSAGIIILQ